MFEKLFSKIKDPAVEIINQHSNIPSGKKEILADDALACISQEVERLLDSGDFSQLKGINKEENTEANPTIQNIVNSFSKKLEERTTMSETEAAQTSQQIIPALFSKVKDQFSGEGMDLKSLMSNLSLSDMMKLMANMGKIKEAFGK